jgi:hypothetical protein
LTNKINRYFTALHHPSIFSFWYQVCGMLFLKAETFSFTSGAPVNVS